MIVFFLETTCKEKKQFFLRMVLSSATLVFLICTGMRKFMKENDANFVLDANIGYWARKTWLWPLFSICIISGVFASLDPLRAMPLRNPTKGVAFGPPHSQVLLSYLNVHFVPSISEYNHTVLNLSHIKS